MTHARRIENYKQQMADKRINPYTASPPFWRMLWYFGVALPPPLYMGFLPMALMTGALFGIFFGGFVYLYENWGDATMSAGQAGLIALGSGIAFGVAFSWYSRYLARKHGLGHWSEVGPARPRS